MLAIDPDIKQAILSHASPAEIFSLAKKQGFLTMKEISLIKMLRSETSVEEIERVLS